MCLSIKIYLFRPIRKPEKKQKLWNRTTVVGHQIEECNGKIKQERSREDSNWYPILNMVLRTKHSSYSLHHCTLCCTHQGPATWSLPLGIFVGEKCSKGASTCSYLFPSQGFVFACMFSHVQLLVTPWTVKSTRLLCPQDSPGKNTGVGCHFLLQGNLPNPGIKLASPVASALAGGFSTTEPPRKP